MGKVTITLTEVEQKTILKAFELLEESYLVTIRDHIAMGAVKASIELEKALKEA